MWPVNRDAPGVAARRRRTLRRRLRVRHRKRSGRLAGRRGHRGRRLCRRRGCRGRATTLFGKAAKRVGVRGDYLGNGRRLRRHGGGWCVLRRRRDDRAVDFDEDHVARAADAVLRPMREADAHTRERRAVARHGFFDVDVRDRRQRAKDARRQLTGRDVSQVHEHGQRIRLTGDIGDRLARLDENRAVRAVEPRRDRAQLRARGAALDARGIATDFRRDSRRDDARPPPAPRTLRRCRVTWPLRAAACELRAADPTDSGSVTSCSSTTESGVIVLTVPSNRRSPGRIE